VDEEFGQVLIPIGEAFYKSHMIDLRDLRKESSAAWGKGNCDEVNIVTATLIPIDQTIVILTPFTTPGESGQSHNGSGHKAQIHPRHIDLRDLA